MEPTVLQTMITQLGTVMAAILGWAGQILDLVIAQPLLLVFVGLPILGFAFMTIKGFLHN